MKKLCCSLLVGSLTIASAMAEWTYDTSTKGVATGQTGSLTDGNWEIQVVGDSNNLLVTKYAVAGSGELDFGDGTVTGGGRPIRSGVSPVTISSRPMPIFRRPALSACPKR